MLVEPIYVLTDTAVVGRLGTVPLAGLALASTVLNTLVWVFNFLSYGTTVRVAVRRGRGDNAGGAADALQALWLALGIGLVAAAVIAVGARWLVGIVGDEAAAIEQGTTYLRISAVGIPFQLVTVASIGYLYGLPDTTRPFIVLACTTTINLLVELLLVYGFDWGIAGSAWGTVLAEILGAVAMIAIVTPRLRRDGLARLVVVPSVMWAVLKVGAHLVQRTAFLLAALAVATAAASRVGTVELAGHQIAAQLFIFLAVGVDMFKVSGQSLVGNALGAQRHDEARDVVDHMIGWGWRAGVLLTIVTVRVSARAAATVQRRLPGVGSRHGRATNARSDAGTWRVHVRARRSSDGSERLPRLAMVDHARLRDRVAGVRRGVHLAVARDRDRVAGATRLDLGARREEPHARPRRRVVGERRHAPLALAGDR